MRDLGYRQRGEGEPRPFRSLFRIIGPLLIVAGVGTSAVGLIDFFAAFAGFGQGGGFGHAPTKFWMLFIGFPCIAIGVAITQFAYIGSILRYFSRETRPVAKETFNYLARGTRPGVRDLTSAVAEGLREVGLAAGAGAGVAAKTCPACGAANDTAANFCDSCGKPLGGAKTCGRCGNSNDADARFCDDCGAPLR